MLRDTVIRSIISASLALVALAGAWSVIQYPSAMARDPETSIILPDVVITIDEIIASGFVRPVQVTNAGDGSQRLFVVEQPGSIWIVQDRMVVGTPFLDISGLVQCCGERGLLGLAFHPDYKDNGHFYVNYTRKGDGATVVARYSVSEDPNIADPDSGSILLTVAQPYSNHNGGQLLFCPDGYLYIGMGDGGSGGDPLNHGQNRDTLLGAMLRIDVDGGTPYAIPPDNPYVGEDGADEIWAIGLRNPWRFSFDRETGDLYIGDVGQNLWEATPTIRTLPAMILAT
jgi:glucose/arabinose dehydrogenase